MASYSSVFDDIKSELAHTDVVDVHTHLRWEHPHARSLQHLLSYHFVQYELQAAGMPREVRFIRD